MEKAKKQHSLRLTVFLVMGSTLFSFVVVIFSIFHAITLHMLTQTEETHAKETYEAVAKAMNEMYTDAGMIAKDMAFWDDAVRFASGEFPDFIEKNWGADSLLQHYQYSFVVIKDLSGRDLYVEFHDYIHNTPKDPPSGFSGRLTTLAREVTDACATIDNITVSDQTGMSGILADQDRFYYIVGMPIVSFDPDAQPAGTLFIGRLLDDTNLKAMSYRGQDIFTMTRSDTSDGEPVPYRIERESDNQISLILPFEDLDGQALSLRITGSRDVFQTGLRTISVTALIFLSAVGLFIIIFYLLVTRSLLRPLESISTDIGKIADGEQGIDETKYEDTVEYTRLSSSINDMLARLNQSRREAAESRVSLEVFNNILNNMDAYLYVTDPETDRILFVNDRLVDQYHIKGNPVGQVCWQILQADQTERCDFCPLHTLANNPDETVVWEEHSTVTGHIYKNTDCLIDWADGKKVHLQHSVDITPIRKVEKTLQSRLEQQELMTRISQSFISSMGVQSLIRDALAMAGQFLNVSHLFLGRYEEGDERLYNDCDWVNEARPAQGIQRESILFRQGTILYDAFLTDQKEYLAETNIAGWEEYAPLNETGVCGCLAVPITVSGLFWGILCLEQCHAPRTWTESDIQLVKLIGTVISGVLTREKTEKELHVMSSIVDYSPLFISFGNETGGFEYINQGAADLTGYTKEELAAGGIPLLFPEESAKKMNEKVIPRAYSFGKCDCELPITMKNGQTRIISLSVFTAKSGGRVGLGTIGSDITMQRQLEKDLVAAKEQAEQSSRAKSNFLARMSHEMRTPMNAIIGMTTIGRASGDAEKKEYCLEKINDASKHLLGVINDILDMSKIESGKFELNDNEFELEKMLQRVVNVINFRVEEKQQNLMIKVDKNLPYYMIADEQRLSQVITNLLSNAVKFTPEHGNITLDVRKLSEDDAGVSMQVTVTDTGIGISPEKQGRLFHSFEQADGSITRKYGGTGLGLAISKKIVDLMGGRIWVESVPEHGARFIFTVRLRRGETSRRNLLSPEINWKNLRLLTVDDAPDVLEFFQSVAESIGVDCGVAQNGFAACEILEQSQQEHPFNFVFVDWKMPGMNGIELTRRIKETYGDKTVVIMISATEWSDIEEEARKAGVDRFLPKPLFPSSIVNCINECLGTQQTVAGNEPETDFTGCFDGVRVLLAEDVKINREILLELLHSTGVQIDCVEDGKQGLDAFQRNPDAYNMIFMDIHMPEMDGYEATRHIRALDIPRAKTIPILAMTANVFREDIEKCLAAGMNGHIGKPIDLEEVIKAMRKHLPANRNE